MLVYGIYEQDLKITYRTTLDLDHPTLVCTKEDCNLWIKSGLNLRFIDAQSSFGKTLLDIHQAHKNLLFFEDEGIHTVLTNMTPAKFNKYLIGLQNYRAGYRPVHPPVHSEDVPRDLSPNAN